MCWWGCGWCVARLVPRHSWLRFPCATPRHSWLGFAAGGGGRSSPLLAEVSGRRWCVVGLWLVCGVFGPSPLVAEVPVCYSPPLLAGFRCLWWCAVPRHSWLGPAGGGGAWRVVCGVWCVVCGGGVLVGLWLWLVPRLSWWRFLCSTPRHSWLGFDAGGGGRSSPLLAEGPGRGFPPLLAGVRWRRWCVVGLWLVCGVFGPSPLLAEVCVCYSPPLLAGFRCLWWCAVPRHSWLGPAGGGGAWRVVCGVWCVVCGGGVWWVCGWCGWFLATPGGGSCVLLPATPGWVSMPVAVGGPRHSWLRALGAVPRHSWLGFAGGGGVWWGCGWCVVWLVPRHPWRSFLCATPRHSWLGFAAGGGVRFPATPGWGLLAVVVRGVWCVVCGGGVLAGLWVGVVWLVPRHSWRRFLCATPRHSRLGFAAGGGGRSPPLLAGVRWRRWCVVCGGGVLVVGPSPLLAEVPVCYSPPLLAGFRCRRWWVVCGVWCAACGVRRWRVWWVCGWCGWSLATPGGGSCVLLPATPGWVSLPVVVGGPRHSWLGSAGGGGVWCVAVVCWLLVPRHSWRRFLCATPRHSWLGFAAGGGGRSPPLLAGVRWRRWCVVCGGGVLVVGPSPLLAEVPVCYSPPLLAGFRCRRWWAFLATPGGGSRARFPATPGWVSLPAVVRGVRCVVCGVWRAAVACVVGLWLVWLVPRHSWRRFLCATPRHSWLGFAAGGGVVWCCGGCVFRVPFPLALVCVCALCGPSCWCGWRGGGGGVALGVAVVRARACACGVWLVGWGVSYLGWFSSSVVGMFQKAAEEVL